MHEKILRDLKPLLEALARKDKAAYIEIEKDLMNAYGKAIYRLEQANYRAKGEGGKVKKGGKGRR
jgi:hypothetical protein